VGQLDHSLPENRQNYRSRTPSFGTQAARGLRDPAAGLERLRAAGPVLDVRFPIVGRTWITTTEGAGSRVLKDSQLFTLRKDGVVAGTRWWMPGIVRTLANTMLTTDEPDHTRLRSIVDEAFRRRAILDMEPRIRALADTLAAELFADGSPADLVVGFARKLPLSVICELLGRLPTGRDSWRGRAASPACAARSVSYGA
jgi:cytochrome P450